MRSNSRAAANNGTAVQGVERKTNWPKIPNRKDHGINRRTVHGVVRSERQHHADERGGQQHCQRQYHRVQGEPGAVYSAILRNGRGGNAADVHHRRIKSEPDRVGRDGCQHRAGLHPRLDSDHRRQHRSGHRRKWFLHHKGIGQSTIHARWRLHAERQQPACHRERRLPSGICRKSQWIDRHRAVDQRCDSAGNQFALHADHDRFDEGKP